MNNLNICECGNPPNIFSQIKFLVVDKGMNLEEAIREIESKLHGRLPDHILNLIREVINENKA